VKDKEASEFDRYAINYDEELGKGLSLTGEDKVYYVNGRIEWLSHQLKKFGLKPNKVLDFGCGVGSSSPILLEKLGLDNVIGVDVSEKSLAEARRRYGSETVQFIRFDEFCPKENIDLVYCNGVFHHIPPERRLWTVDFIYRSLRPDGIFALWENNPWNLGTRLIMSRVAFDHDAVMLWPSQAKRLLIKCNFKIVNISYMFVFPKIMRMFRCVEPFISSIPFGGQYLVLGIKDSRKGQKGHD